MPAQKRPLTDTNADVGCEELSVRNEELEQENEPMGEAEQDDEEELEEEEDEEDGATAGEAGGAEDSQGSQSSEAADEIPDFVCVRLADIRKDLQCPICLGIIRKTRTVMECLHWFCRECIDKSMRLGNNECPACRTHCASRRSLRDDTNYDSLIATLHPNIDKYEEEELAFHEEERNRNKQNSLLLRKKTLEMKYCIFDEVQASMAQILQRQVEALAKRRSGGKDAVGGFATRSQRNIRSAYTRRRRNRRGAEHIGSEDYKDENDSNGGKCSSSADEQIIEVRPQRRRRRTVARSTVPSTSADCEGPDNETEATTDMRGICPGLVWNPEMLAWGRGGTRSHTRHGSSNGSNKNVKNSRTAKLVEYLKNLEENDELDMYFVLVPLEKEITPSLKQPYLSSRVSLSMKTLTNYIGRQSTLQAEEVEILLVNGHNNINFGQLCLNQTSRDERKNPSPVLDPCKAELHLLDKEETLARIIADSKYTRNHVILGYRRRKPPSS